MIFVFTFIKFAPNALAVIAFFGAVAFFAATAGLLRMI